MNFHKFESLQLQLFGDKNDLLRVKTKLAFIDEHELFKYPILLPNKHEWF